MSHVHVKTHQQHARTHDLRMYEYAGFAVLVTMALLLAAYFLVFNQPAVQEQNNPNLAEMPAAAAAANPILNRDEMRTYSQHFIPNAAPGVSAPAANPILTRAELNTYAQHFVPNAAAVQPFVPVVTEKKMGEVQTYWQFYRDHFMSH